MYAAILVRRDVNFVNFKMRKLVCFKFVSDEKCKIRKCHKLKAEIEYI